MTDHEWNVAEEQAEFVSNLPHPGGIVGALMPVAGFGVTLRNFFRPTVTEQYPTTPANIQPKYHGRHQLNRYADGLEKCIGCELCAWACPADAILVEADSNTIDAQFSPGERYGRVYQINYLRCIFCGLCIEACPTRALTMTNEIELAGPTREGLIYEKQDLLAPMHGRQLAAPHPMVEGTTDTNYYTGDVLAPTSEQEAWVRAHRPDDPTLPENNEHAHDSEAYIPHAEHAEPGVPTPLGAQRFTAPLMGGVGGGGIS